MNCFTANFDFAFLAPGNCLQTSGRICSIDYGNHSSFAIDATALLASAEQGFKQAKAAGQTSPIMVGAIPFDARDGASLFIPQHYSFSHSAQLPVSGKTATNRLQQLEHMFAAADYQAVVNQAIELLRRQQLKKVVLSQSIKLTFAEPVNALQLLHNLLQQNPESYNYSVPTEAGVFVGSSPELLISKRQQNISLQPLAGSAARAADPQQDQANAEQLLASKKDLHEHRLVVEYIVEVLQQFNLKLQLSATPSLVKTAKLWHLGTKIEAQFNASEQCHILALLAALQPTPALCGAPRAAAAEFILQHEPISRQYFGGAVGWCDAHGDGEWAVAIRGALLQQNQAKLYAGAGIVTDSVAEQEWDETQQKLKVILQALNIGN